MTILNEMLYAYYACSKCAMQETGNEIKEQMERLQNDDHKRNQK